MWMEWKEGYMEGWMDGWIEEGREGVSWEGGMNGWMDSMGWDRQMSTNFIKHILTLSRVIYTYLKPKSFLPKTFYHI